jgi:hypothetical protein
MLPLERIERRVPTDPLGKRSMEPSTSRSGCCWGGSTRQSVDPGLRPTQRCPLYKQSFVFLMLQVWTSYLANRTGLAVSGSGIQYPDPYLFNHLSNVFHISRKSYAGTGTVILRNSLTNFCSGDIIKTDSSHGNHIQLEDYRISKPVCLGSRDPDPPESTRICYRCSVYYKFVNKNMQPEGVFLSPPLQYKHRGFCNVRSVIGQRKKVP